MDLQLLCVGLAPDTELVGWHASVRSICTVGRLGVVVVTAEQNQWKLKCRTDISH